MLDHWARLTKRLAPSDAETVALLQDLFRHLGERQTAALTGITLNNLHHIIRRNGRSSAQTKAHVWLVWSLLLHPGALKDCLGLLTFGRFTVNSGPQHAGGKPTHWQASRGRVGRYYPRKNPSANKGGRGRKNPIAPVSDASDASPSPAAV